VNSLPAAGASPGLKRTNGTPDQVDGSAVLRPGMGLRPPGAALPTSPAGVRAART